MRIENRKESRAEKGLELLSLTFRLLETQMNYPALEITGVVEFRHKPRPQDRMRGH